MKLLIRYLLILPFSGILAQSIPLFETDLRMRVVEDDLLYVVVQIENNSGRTITELEGYLTEVDPSLNIMSEKKVVHLHPYEAPFGPNQTIIRGLTYTFDRTLDYRYRYHISKVRVTNDSRVFMYSPNDGLVRVD